MSERYGLETFILDIDKITSGQAIVLPNEDCDRDFNELLQLAQLLAQADYSKESQIGVQKLLAKHKEKDELEDDELDLVAGGTNPDGDLVKKKK